MSSGTGSSGLVAPDVPRAGRDLLAGHRREVVGHLERAEALRTRVVRPQSDLVTALAARQRAGVPEGTLAQGGPEPRRRSVGDTSAHDGFLLLIFPVAALAMGRNWHRSHDRTHTAGGSWWLPGLRRAVPSVPLDELAPTVRRSSQHAYSSSTCWTLVVELAMSVARRTGCSCHLTRMPNRRHVSPVASAVAALALTAAWLSPPAVAAGGTTATCDGHPATIVGTPGPRQAGRHERRRRDRRPRGRRRRPGPGRRRHPLRRRGRRQPAGRRGQRHIRGGAGDDQIHDIVGDLPHRRRCGRRRHHGLLQRRAATSAADPARTTSASRARTTGSTAAPTTTRSSCRRRSGRTWCSPAAPGATPRWSTSSATTSTAPATTS